MKLHERQDRFVREVQRWLGVEEDGDPQTTTWGAWHRATEDELDLATATRVARAMFPESHARNRIPEYLPEILKALEAFGILSPEMLLMALATVRAETAGFVPISEGRSRFNTSPGGHPFDLYDDRSDLGNRGKPDGERYKGRGFIQLTGRDNYRRIGEVVGVDLEGKPELANDARVAALILAAFLEMSQARIRAALRAGNLEKVRRIVNGGRHGLEEFEVAYRNGEAALTQEVTA